MDRSSWRPVPGPPKLLDQVREELQKRRYSPRTEQVYIAWILRYIRFHGSGIPPAWENPRSNGSSRRLPPKGT